MTCWSTFSRVAFCPKRSCPGSISSFIHVSVSLSTQMIPISRPSIVSPTDSSNLPILSRKICRFFTNDADSPVRPAAPGSAGFQPAKGGGGLQTAAPDRAQRRAPFFKDRRDWRDQRDWWETRQPRVSRMSRQSRWSLQNNGPLGDRALPYRSGAALPHANGSAVSMPVPAMSPALRVMTVRLSQIGKFLAAIRGRIPEGDGVRLVAEIRSAAPVRPRCRIP